ncbi:CsbD family protein [Streptomyces sp. NPDC020742]|uniref:CsbD family protein n=1 Tax=Streptomyces sp. NPDC020742 TaxID=3154897 RepID=UPI0033D77F3A
MTANGKTTARTQQAIGAVQETAGRVVDHDRIAREGRSERAEGDLRRAEEKAEEAVRR